MKKLLFAAIICTLTWILSSFAFAGQVLLPPIASPNGGTYKNSVDVTFGGSYSDTTEIYYTIDGSRPDQKKQKHNTLG